jgi:hypothetical protein
MASVAMLEKFALLKMALCKAPVVSRASEFRESGLSESSDPVRELNIQ